MSSPYRHAVAALRERHEEALRALDETDAAIAILATKRMRLQIELDALAQRLEVARRSSLDASAAAYPVGDRKQRLAILAATSSVVALGVATAFSWDDSRPMRDLRCITPPHVGCSVVKCGFIAAPADEYRLPDALRLEDEGPDLRRD